MIMTPIRPEHAPDRPKLEILEDAAADLDTASTFSRAAEHLVSNLRDWVRMLKLPQEAALLRDINDLETLVKEAQWKTDEAQRTIVSFNEGELAARRSSTN